MKLLLTSIRKPRSGEFRHPDIASGFLNGDKLVGCGHYFSHIEGGMGFNKHAVFPLDQVVLYRMREKS